MARPSAGIRRVGVALVATACLLGAACGRRAAGPDEVLSLDDQTISYQAFEAYLARQVGDDGAAMPSQVLSGLFDQFVEERLLERWARDEGLGGGETTPLEALVETLDVGPPSDEEIREVYESSPERFTRPIRVRLRQMLLPDEATARRALDELRAGTEFLTVARSLATPPFEAVGGDGGVVTRADVPKAFADVIFSLGEGEVSGMVRAEYGYHIFQVVERLPEERLSLAEATPEIRRELERRAADRQLGALVKRAAQRYNVEVHVRNLPFEYRGRFAQAPPSLPGS